MTVEEQAEQFANDFFTKNNSNASARSIFKGTIIDSYLAGASGRWIKILEWLKLISEAYRTENDTVVIEWVNSTGGTLSLEIGYNNHSYFVMMKGKETVLVDGMNDTFDFNKLELELTRLFNTTPPTE